MTKQNLIDFGAQILAMEKVTRWELDPEDDKLEDYIHEDIIGAMWNTFNIELSNLGGLSNSNIIDYLDEALWEGMAYQKIDFQKIFEQGQKKYNTGFSYGGQAAVDFYRPFVELIVDNAIKIGAIIKEKQRYFKKQGQV